MKILYLQDNLIEKMEGLSKLKELEYINLAVNSVSLVEGVRGCESLQRSRKAALRIPRGFPRDS